MSNFTMAVRLLNTTGEEVLHAANIHCRDNFPKVIRWDDAPEGPRTFLHHEGGDYREVCQYVMSLGRSRVTAAIWDANLAAAKKCMPEASAIETVTRTHGPRPAE